MGCIPPASAPSIAEFTELEKLKSELNDYAKALRDPIGEMLVSPHLLYSRKDEALRYFESVGKPLPQVSFPNAANISLQEYDNIKEHLRNMVAVLSLVGPLNKHPWRGSKPGLLLPADEMEIRKSIEKCSGLLSDLMGTLHHLQSSCGITYPKTFGEIPDTLRASFLVTQNPIHEREAITNPKWNTASKQVDDLIEKIRTLNSDRAAILRIFREEVLTTDAAGLLNEFEKLSGRFFKLFSGRYRQLKKDVQTLYEKKPTSDDSIIVYELRSLVSFQGLYDEVISQDNFGRELFGATWNSTNSDAEQLRSTADWVLQFRHQLNKGLLEERAIDIICGNERINSSVDASKDGAQILTELYNKFGDILEKIGATYQSVFECELIDISFSKMEEFLSLWITELPKLQLWSRFITVREECLRGKAAPIVALIDDGSLTSDEIIHCFEANFSDNLLEVAFTSRPALAQFVGDLHEKKISRFRELDSASITTSGRVLRHDLFAKRPTMNRGASPGSLVGILLSEINRRRGHMPIRKLMSAAGSLIQDLKPCFMMSPLSIAQFLDPRSVTFDVIIFDEASQVRPEDALGAFLRGKQVVVLGDVDNSLQRPFLIMWLMLTLMMTQITWPQLGTCKAFSIFARHASLQETFAGTTEANMNP